MIKGKIKAKIELTKDEILSKTDDYNIIRFYLGQDFDFKRKFASPFREKDNNPNLCFFPGENSKILFKDFANGKSGDCFKFVQELFKLNFHKALIKIDKDLGLGILFKTDLNSKIHIVKKPDSIHKQDKLIQIVDKPFTKEELKYWADYHISEEELKEHHVYSIDKLYINKQLIFT